MSTMARSAAETIIRITDLRGEGASENMPNAAPALLTLVRFKKWGIMGITARSGILLTTMALVAWSPMKTSSVMAAVMMREMFLTRIVRDSDIQRITEYIPQFPSTLRSNVRTLQGSVRPRQRARNSSSSERTSCPPPSGFEPGGLALRFLARRAAGWG